MSTLSYIQNNQNIKYFTNFILGLKDLLILDLSNNLIKYIPDKLSDLEDLDELYLQNNKLLKLSNGVCKLRNLRILNISNNKIENLSIQINNLINLQSLNLSNNNLSYIPLSFYKLINLKELDLSNNNLKYVSISICKLKSLETLNLKNNKIAYLTKNIKYLTNLRIFLIGNNLLKKLPNEITNMDNLEQINIENNPFITFPTKVLKIPRLTHLYDDNNRIINIDSLRKEYELNNELDFLKIQVKDYKLSNYINNLWKFKEFKNFLVIREDNEKFNEIIELLASKSKNYNKIPNKLNNIVNKDLTQYEFKTLVNKNINELEKLETKPYDFVFKENSEMNKFKPAIKLLYPLLSKKNFINDFKENIDNVYRKTLGSLQCVYKKLEEGKRKTKIVSKNDSIQNINDDEIEVIYDYLHSSLVRKKYILNKYCNGDILPIFKFTKNDLQDPTSFRYMINYNKIIKIIDKLWCIDVLSKCKNNVPNRKIFKSNLLYYDFSKIVNTAMQNTKDLNNVIIIDIDKAYDSINWKLMKKLLLTNLTRKINETEAKKFIDEYFLILSNSTIYYNNQKIKIKHGIPIGLTSSNIIFNFMMEEITIRWLYSIKNYISEFKINIYVDDIFFKFYKTENLNFIITSFINHFQKYNLKINKNKFKVSPSLKLNLECTVLKPTDFYLGLPFTRDIKLYGELILKEYQKKYLHNFDWMKIYTKIITNDINSISILGYMGYKLRPFLKYDENYNLRIVRFIKKFYL
jgi:Leucine-rich repeat (LRR) protein